MYIEPAQANSTQTEFELHASHQKLKPYSMAEDICRFMVAFKHTPYKDFRDMTPEDWAFRDKLNMEELEETVDAYDMLRNAQSIETLAHYTKEVLDSVYVLVGSLVKMGVPTDLCWKEVQRSNMAKMQPDGTVRYREDGKILKPDDWTPADLVSILRKHYMLDTGD